MVQPLVGIVMGSQSDWPTMRAAAEVLDALGIAHEARIVSAHRTPARLWDYGTGAAARGLKVIVAGAGGAAHLPGMMASKTLLPVIGVPVQGRALGGLDSLYSISDRVAVVADQKIVEVSPIAELERSDHPWIRAFLGGRAERAKERNR